MFASFIARSQRSAEFSHSLYCPGAVRLHSTKRTINLYPLIIAAPNCCAAPVDVAITKKTPGNVPRFLSDQTADGLCGDSLPLPAPRAAIVMRG